MGKNIKGIILIGVSLVALCGGIFLSRTDYAGYELFVFAIAGILFLFGVGALISNSNPNRAYEAKVRDILNTYDSVLVKSASVPKLEGRNIINVESMDDLIDAQLEIRKPICYLKQTESCSFILLDDKEAYVYVEKLNEEVTSPVDIELKEMKVKTKSEEEMDSEMLRDIDKTTIVKLSNKKSYKVSPIRKKKEVKDDIEVLDF